MLTYYGKTFREALIGFSGCISPKSTTMVVDLIRKTGKDLVIQSEGGGAGDGLLIAEIVKEKRITVTVRGYCLSSCANYIMPAAVRLLVEGDAIIMLHGDARTFLQGPFLDKTVDDGLLNEMKRLAKLEIAFEANNPKAKQLHLFQEIVNRQPDEVTKLTINGKATGCPGKGHAAWHPSLQWLIRFGIIDLIIPYSENRLPAMVTKELDRNVFGVTLESDLLFGCDGNAP